MGMEAAQNGQGWSEEVKQKFCELSKLVAREKFGEQGVPQTIDFATIEQIGHEAGRQTAAEVNRQLTEEHAAHFLDPQPCPQCDRLCECKMSHRRLVTRDGPVELNEMVCHCPACRRDFFPQRITLKLDSHDYSPAVLEQIVTAGGIVKSYESAAVLLQTLAEVEISSRHVNNMTVAIGRELHETCCQQAKEYKESPLPRQPTKVDLPPQLAYVGVDGGRMQTRQPNHGSGVHEAGWRETKNAGFFRMKTTSFAEDPHPNLPRCFADRRHMAKLLDGLSEEVQTQAEPEHTKPIATDDWRPQVQFRTCLSSLVASNSFGWMMAAEADRRGFYVADKRAFLGDGLGYNWTLQRMHFPTFEPILDFIHPLEYLYEVARAVGADSETCWDQYVAWAEQCWQGRVAEVLAELDALAKRLGPPPDKDDEKDSRVVIRHTLVYLRNNQSRMDYPRYRIAGLPTTSCLIESLVKEVNYRVKGTEKFWNDGETGEAILHVRAAILSHDNRLRRHLRVRPGSPFARTRAPTASTAT